MNVLQLLNQHYDTVAHTHPKPMLVETARAMMISYFLRWEKEDSKTIVRGIEVPFSVPLPDPGDLPEWVRPTKQRFIGGIIDSIIERGGEIHITDLKTTGWASPDYWHELHTNPQLTQYSFALAMAEFVGVAAEWDVVEKPGIDPKKLTIAAKADIESGTYCGWPTSDGVPDDGQESPRLYGLRLLNWYADNPQKMDRRIYRRNERELLEYVYAEHARQSEMESTLLRGGDKSWSCKSESACFSFGGLCDYHPVCAGFDPDRQGFKTREKRVGAPDMGVTPSQTKCFQHCRQHWLFKYGHRIEPVVKRDSDPMDLGTLCHSGREVILKARLSNPIVLPLEQPMAVIGQ